MVESIWGRKQPVVKEKPLIEWQPQPQTRLIKTISRSAYVGVEWNQ
jgi:hypothetical protein